MFIVGFDRPFYPQVREAATIDEARTIATELKQENGVEEDESDPRNKAKIYIAEVIEVIDILTDY